MIKDLSGSIWEVNTTNCPAGYGSFRCCLGIILQDGSVYNKKALSMDFGNDGLRLAIGYTSEETTTAEGTIMQKLVEKENSIVIIASSGQGESSHTLQVGEKLVFICGESSIEPFSLFKTNLINYVENNWTFVNIPNRYYNLVSNNKYIRKINGKNIRKIEANNKQYNLRPYANLPEYTTLSVDSLASDSNQAIKIWNFGETLCEIYKNNELVAQVEPFKDLYFEDTVLADEITTYEFRGGKINLDVDLANTCVVGNNYNTIIGFKAGQIIKAIYVNFVATNFNNDRVVVYMSVSNIDITKYPSYVSILLDAFLLSKQANIIPRSVFFIDSGYAPVGATTITAEITFEHLETDTLYLSPLFVPKYKQAKTLTIKHYGNPAVLNYDWASLNITPTFVDLREQQ